ncbi:carboxypeptidase regulatory-like domain-containing protein [Patescibacteria group bacterium]|nr:carboxypeptidase regulatory-like domain-containing protein [Patescibacteria group bacterium]
MDNLLDSGAEPEELADHSDTPVEAPPKKSTGKEVQLTFSKRKLVFWLVLLLIFAIAVLAVLTWKLRWYQPVLDRYNTASVSLKVREGDTFALEGAKLTVAGKTYKTDRNGKVQIPQIVAGTYKVQVTDSGYHDTAVTIQLHRGDNNLMYIGLTKLPEKTYSVKGTVHDYVSDQPVVNVQVTLGSQTVQTDPSGSYGFDHVAPGNLKLIFSKAGYLDKEVDQQVTDTNISSTPIPLEPTGQVIFVSNRDGRRELYASNYDGTNQKLFITPSGQSEDFGPVLSPDHKTLAFVSTRDQVKDGNGNVLEKLYVVGQDGKNLKKVSDDVSSDFAPIWSPNGQYLYYAGYTGSDLTQNSDKVYNVAKGTLTDIGEAANDVVFSPDSTMIAYYVLSSQSQPPPTDAPAGTPTTVSVNVIKTLNLVTGERKTISNRNQSVSDLEFSSDNASVIYEVLNGSSLERFQDNIATPSQETQLPVPTFSNRRYVASPDGSHQVFIEERDGKKDLYLVDQNRDNEKKLTNLGMLNDQILPLWDDTSAYVIFAVKGPAESALYIVSINGGDPKKVTDFYTPN